MPRNRLLKREFFRDEKVAGLTFGARLLFQSLWIQADDSGNGRADARLLKSEAFPYDDVTVAQVEGMVDEIVKSGMVRTYEANGARHYSVVNFSRHQTIDRPSKFRHPSPPWSDQSQEHSQNTQRVLDDESKRSTVKVKVKEESRKRTSKETAADAADGKQADRTRRGDDSDLTETADGHRCTRKVKSNEDVLRFAGLERKRFGKDVDPRFYGKLSGVFVEYRERCHQDGRCDCAPSEFLDDVIRACEDDNIRYPAGVLARLKQLQRAA